LKSLSIQENKNQTVKSIIALFYMLSMLPEMPLEELIGLVSIKMKGMNLKERPGSLTATMSSSADLLAAGLTQGLHGR